MYETINLANGQMVEMRSMSVGPKHDPYSRTIVTRYGPKSADSRRRPVIWALVICGLAGEWMEGPDGSKIAELHEPMFDKEAAKQAMLEYRATVARVTGFDQQFWFGRVWEKRDAARWRSMTPDQRIVYEEMRDYDARLLRYAQ